MEARKVVCFVGIILMFVFLAEEALGAMPTPGSIAYPSSSSSGSYIITWTSATNPNGYRQFYHLQEQKNNGTWVTVSEYTSSGHRVGMLSNGNYKYRVRACSDELGCGAYRTGTTIAVVSLQAPTSTLSASPTEIPVSGSSNLTWSSTHASNCTLDGVSVEPSGSKAFSNINASRDYTLNCQNALQSVQKIQRITVVPAPIISAFYANPGVVGRGSQTTLHWAVSNAASCTINGASASTPHATAPLTADTTFALVCSGIGGTASSSVIVQAPPPPAITSFTSAANPVEAGMGTTLNWASSNATSCRLNNQPVATSSGSYPTGTLTGNIGYTLVCDGYSGSASRNLSLTVAPRTTLSSFTLDANPIAAGQSTIVRWSVANANSCTMNGTTIPSSGSQNTGVKTNSESFRIQCAGTLNNIDQSLALTVNPAPVISSFNPDQNPIAIGHGTTLRWSTVNATSCTLNGATVSVMGAQSTGALSVNKQYSLICIGTNGATASRDITIVATPEPVATLSSNFTHVETSSGTTVNWTSNNSTSCTLNGNAVALNGSVATGPLTSSKAYDLICVSGVGSVSKSITVTVVPLQTLWRSIGQCDPRTGRVQQICGDSRGCSVNETRTSDAVCKVSTDCQP